MPFTCRAEAVSVYESMTAFSGSGHDEHAEHVLAAGSAARREVQLAAREPDLARRLAVHEHGRDRNSGTRRTRRCDGRPTGWGP